MMGNLSHVQSIYLACGYTDYPRSIIIREDCYNFR